MSQIGYSKQDLLLLIKSLPEAAQECLLKLFAHQLANFPIEFKKTAEIELLYSNGLVRPALIFEDFKELKTHELESILKFFGELLTEELPKTELIRRILSHSKELENLFIPVFNFGYKNSVKDYLFKKFNWSLLDI